MTGLLAVAGVGRLGADSDVLVLVLGARHGDVLVLRLGLGDVLVLGVRRGDRLGDVARLLTGLGDVLVPDLGLGDVAHLGHHLGGVRRPGDVVGHACRLRVVAAHHHRVGVRHRLGARREGRLGVVLLLGDVLGVVENLGADPHLGSTVAGDDLSLSDRARLVLGVRQLTIESCRLQNPAGVELGLEVDLGGCDGDVLRLRLAGGRAVAGGRRRRVEGGPDGGRGAVLGGSSVGGGQGGGAGGPHQQQQSTTRHLSIPVCGVCLCVCVADCGVTDSPAGDRPLYTGRPALS